MSSITVFLFCLGAGGWDAELLIKRLPGSTESGYGFLEVRGQGQTEGIFTADP